MSAVELIYDADCPNVDAARDQLLRALQSTCMPLRWQEWERNAPDSPPHVRGFGSPTILVNGDDVATAGRLAEVDASCCRLYRHSDGRTAGAPDFEQIRAALLRAGPALPASGARPLLENASTVLPGIGLALLPKLTCAACWPAYAWLLGALGLNFLDYTPYVLPLMVVFLAMAVVSLAYRARTRHGYGPLLAGTIAATLMLAGKFAFDSDIATYAGAGLLTVAFAWNVWPTPKHCHAAR